MGLRTLEGVTLTELTPLDIPARRFQAMKSLVQARNGRLVATPAGRPVLDRVIAELAAGG